MLSAPPLSLFLSFSPAGKNFISLQKINAYRKAGQSAARRRHCLAIPHVASQSVARLTLNLLVSCGLYSKVHHHIGRASHRVAIEQRSKDFNVRQEGLLPSEAWLFSSFAGILVPFSPRRRARPVLYLAIPRAHPRYDEYDIFIYTTNADVCRSR